MKSLFLLPVLGCVLLLTGCAGVGSDFECNATTGDHCMTMQQANQQAREKTDSARVKPGAGKLPGLVNLPPQASVSTSATVQPVSRPAAPAVTPSRPPLTSPATPASAGQPPVRLAVISSGLSCGQLRCDNPGQIRPQRSPEQLASVWVAPWVSDDDVLHQPGRVSFVAAAPQWQLPSAVN